MQFSEALTKKIYIHIYIELTFGPTLVEYCQKSKETGIIIFYRRIFLTAIWLPHGQLWAISKEQPHSPDVNHCVFTAL